MDSQKFELVFFLLSVVPLAVGQSGGSGEASGDGDGRLLCYHCQGGPDSACGDNFNQSHPSVLVKECSNTTLSGSSCMLAHIDPRTFPDWIPDGLFPDGFFENGTHSRGCTPWEQDSIACALNFNWLDVTCCSDSLCNNQKTVTRTTTTDIATTTIVNEAAPARATVSILLFFTVTIQLMW